MTPQLITAETTVYDVLTRFQEQLNFSSNMGLIQQENVPSLPGRYVSKRPRNAAIWTAWMS